jgi:hypothetical protein
MFTAEEQRALSEANESDPCALTLHLSMNFSPLTAKNPETEEKSRKGDILSKLLH